MKPVDVLTTAAVAKSYGAAWDAADLDAIMALQSEDMVFRVHAAGFEPAAGSEAVRAQFAYFFTAWAGMRFATTALSIGEEMFINQYRFSATLVQPFPLPGTVIEPAGRRVDVDGVDVISVHGGLVRSKDTYLDTLALHSQLTAG